MNPLKILIIEDELLTAHDIRSTLEKAGHSVTDITRNLREVGNSLRQQVPDVALVDIHLAGSSEDGIAIVQAILAQHRLPIIYLTAQTEGAMVAAARQTRPAAYLLKPYRSHELAIQVELAYHNHQENFANPPNPHTAETLLLPVDNGKGYRNIRKDKVMYLAAEGSYVELRLITDPKRIVFSMNIGYLGQFFSVPDFHRLGRSLIVNLNYIEVIEKHQLYVQGMDEPLDYPASCHKELLKKFAIVKTTRQKGIGN